MWRMVNKNRDGEFQLMHNVSKKEAMKRLWQLEEAFVDFDISRLFKIANAYNHGEYKIFITSNDVSRYTSDAVAEKVIRDSKDANMNGGK